MKKYLLYLVRAVAIVSVFLLFVASFLVATQEYQLLPVLMNAGQTGQSRSATDLPSGVEAFYTDTIDFQRLETWRFPAQGVAKGVVIYFAGNGEGFEGMHQGPPAAIANAGFTTYAFTYRGVGRSSGFPSEAGMYLDASAIFSEVIRREPQAASNIILFGSSFGTGVASWLATQIHPRALILNAPYTSIPDVVRTRFLLSYLVSFVHFDLPTETNLSRLRETTAVIVSHGEADEVIPFSLGSKVFAAINSGACKAFLTDSSTGHNDAFWQFRGKIFAELDRCLQL